MVGAFHSCILPGIDPSPAWALRPETGADLCPDWGISLPSITALFKPTVPDMAHTEGCVGRLYVGVSRYVCVGGGRCTRAGAFRTSKKTAHERCCTGDVQAISPLPPRSLGRVHVILDSLPSSSLPKEMMLLLGFTTWELFSLSECDHRV